MRMIDDIQAKTIIGNLKTTANNVNIKIVEKLIKSIDERLIKVTECQ